MKIVIVAPSPYPAAIGGMEYLQQGLERSIKELTSHHCEILKIVSKENNFWDLIGSYRNFYESELNHYDMVISMKYPAWMVRHDHHICYMTHKLRGLYDAYHLNNMPEDFQSNIQEIKGLLGYMKKNKEPKDLDDYFAMLQDLRIKSAGMPQDLFSFPGPFIKKIVKYMDDFALSPKRIKRYYAISKLVRDRKDYFPFESYVKVLYPPAFKDDYKKGKYEHLFTISRLDGPKRIDLAIDAMKHVRSDVMFRIAGTGPMEEHLKRIASSNKRISFEGFVSAAEAVWLYADALAILFTPYQEDYGLVSIEAMKSFKPVITCTDSGGPTELIDDGISGFIVDPDPIKIAQKIDFLATNRKEAARMGSNAFKAVKDISWTYLVSSLLESKEDNKRSNKILKDSHNILVASHFQIYPPRGGGQIRLFHLFKAAALSSQIHIISYGIDKRTLKQKISKGLYETIIPKTRKHLREEGKFHERLGVPSSDTALPLLRHLSPEYEDQLKKEMPSCDIAVFSHPYQVNQVCKFQKDQFLVYEAQDVEYTLKRSAYSKDDTDSKQMLKLIFETEKKACMVSDVITVCSNEDKKSLIALYGVDEDKFIIVPNGVDCENISFTSKAERIYWKDILGIRDAYTVIFVGSWHPPNVEAVRIIQSVARELPDIKFIIIGSICSELSNEKLPANLGLMGVVSDEELKLLYKIADLALNPMTFGSGTNIKMLDYMAAGIPIITTEVGKRGLGLEDGIHVMVSDVTGLKDKIEGIYTGKIDTLSLVENAINLVRKKYDWKIISGTMMDEIEKRYRTKKGF